MELGVEQSVTAFTASEFGRTVMPNGNAGTDHAWGSHHFVVGGAVVGGDMYGTYPQLTCRRGELHWMYRPRLADSDDCGGSICRDPCAMVRGAAGNNVGAAQHQ